MTVINNFSSTCGANYVLYAYIDYGTKFTIAPFKKRKEYASLIQKKVPNLLMWLQVVCIVEGMCA